MLIKSRVYLYGSGTSSPRYFAYIKLTRTHTLTFTQQFSKDEAIADTPEDSAHTSVKIRVIKAKLGKQPSNLLPFVGNSREHMPKGNLNYYNV
ncbi:MAG: hypothetical protein HRT51_12080 [Colwellia sp.]|nr:hypothetical protein [Colwellia sp.]